MLGPLTRSLRQELCGSRKAFDTPLSRRGRPRRPGSATRRSGAYRGGTSTRKSNAARITPPSRDSIRTYHAGHLITLRPRAVNVSGSLRRDSASALDATSLNGLRQALPARHGLVFYRPEYFGAG